MWGRRVGGGGGLWQEAKFGKKRDEGKRDGWKETGGERRDESDIISSAGGSKLKQCPSVTAPHNTALSLTSALSLSRSLAHSFYTLTGLVCLRH